MGLISYGTGSEIVNEAPVTNNGWWPDIDPAAFRAVERIDGSVTPERVASVIEIALADVNRQLAEWQKLQIDSGFAASRDVLTPVWARDEHYIDLYLRAVYATAKASLLERYRDYSATNSGDEKGQAKDEAVDDFRRDARWAVSEIIGNNHATVELI